MAKVLIEESTLTAIGNSIREKTGKSNMIPPPNMPSEISGIQTTPDAVEQASPTISVSSAGLITASATQNAGYVEAGTKSATKQLSTQAAKTVTPSTSNQTAVASGKYTTGAITVKGDSNLKAANIAKGVSIFGVSGTLEVSKVARGTVDITNMGTNTVTVSGLGFKPTFVILYVAPETVDAWNTNHEDYHPWGDVSLYTVYSDGKTLTVYPLMGEELNYDEDTGEEWTYEYVSTHVGVNVKITPTNDGFTISATYGLHNWEHLAQYIAIG